MGAGHGIQVAAIGAAIARALARDGYDLVSHSRSDRAAAEAVAN